VQVSSRSFLRPHCTSSINIERDFLCGLVRLVGSDLAYEGRLEVSRDYGAWGTVCDDEFTDVDAAVFCFQLGFG